MGPSKPCPKYRASRALGLPALVPIVGAAQSMRTSEAGVLMAYSAWYCAGRGPGSLG